MQNRGAIIASLCFGLTCLPTLSSAQDDATYTEYLPGIPPNCEKPILNISGFGSTLDGCQAMYKANNFIEWACEDEALFKQRTAPHLLQQYDVKWLTNVENRKKACMALLARKEKLGLWDRISHWWNP
jgi:hypothetical protein